MYLFSCKTFRSDTGEFFQTKAIANSKDELIRNLKGKGLVLVSSKKTRFRMKQSREDFVLPFFRNLAQLIRNNLNLIISLAIVEKTFKSGEGNLIVEEIISKIKAGETFAFALSQFPDLFDQSIVKIIEVSEKTAGLMDSLDSIVRYLEASISLQEKLKESGRYPLILFSIISFVFSFWIIFLVPKFAELFEEIDLTPPLVSRLLIKFSYFLRGNWPVIAVTTLITYLILRYRDFLFPLIKHIFPIAREREIQKKGEHFIANRLKRDFGTINSLMAIEMLLRGNINLLEALECLKDRLPQLDYIISSIRNGRAFSEAISKTDLFSDYGISIIGVGERAGDVGVAFKTMVDLMVIEIHSKSQKFVSLLQPIAIGTVGLILIIVIVLLVLPLYSNLDLGF